MKQKYIDYEELKRMEKEIGCTFCSDGIFAEMSLIIMKNTSNKGCTF